MIQLLKTKIRRLILKAKDATDEWVIPSEIYDYINGHCYGTAFSILKRQAKLYPNDPEMTKALIALDYESKCYAEDVD